MCRKISSAADLVTTRFSDVVERVFWLGSGHDRYRLQNSHHHFLRWTTSSMYLCAVLHLLSQTKMVALFIAVLTTELHGHSQTLSVSLKGILHMPCFTCDVMYIRDFSLKKSAQTSSESVETAGKAVSGFSCMTYCASLGG